VSTIKEIGATITGIAEIASTIASTMKEQGTATAEIARNVGEAAKGTVEVAEKTTEVNRGATATVRLRSGADIGAFALKGKRPSESRGREMPPHRPRGLAGRPGPSVYPHQPIRWPPR
jgi:hypothetical protein